MRKSTQLSLLVLFAVLVAVLTVGCAKQEPIVTTVTQMVDRPVAVPCLKPGQRPKQPKRLSEESKAPDTLTEMVAKLRAKLVEWQDGYGPTADELLAICEKVPKK